MARTSTSKAKTEPDSTTRDLLLQTASALMTENESVDVSLSEIGDRSGLNTALVKYYFGSKSGMMMALVKQVVGASLARLDALVEMDLPAEEKLALHIKAIVNIYYDYPYVNRLLHRLGRIENGKYGKEIAVEIVVPLCKAEEKILKQGYEAGVFRKVDPMFFYFHVAGACDAIFHSKHALQHAFGVKKITNRLKTEYTDEICSIILRGVMAEKR